MKWLKRGAIAGVLIVLGGAIVVGLTEEHYQGYRP